MVDGAACAPAMITERGSCVAVKNDTDRVLPWT